MAVVVTGVAGFIGAHAALALIGRGERVVGIDNLNDYYPVSLKQSRLVRLRGQSAFSFEHLDIADRNAVADLFNRLAAQGESVTGIVHLAAQAGVRYSLENPYAYVDANVMGQTTLLEAARRLPALRHFVYASSSSVYGANTKLPFAVEDRVDQPVSLYAATKRAGELIAQTYSHLFALPATGLRFFTVYGPWGRPDMAPWLFTEAIFHGRPLRVFNQGRMARDFTYIDDIVVGILAALDHPPQAGESVPHRIYNLGNNRAERLMDFIAVLERAIGRKADLRFEPMQPGDVPVTFADIEASQRDLGYTPITPIEVGLLKFVDWFRDYHGLSMR